MVDRIPLLMNYRWVTWLTLYANELLCQIVVTVLTLKKIFHAVSTLRSCLLVWDAGLRLLVIIVSFLDIFFLSVCLAFSTRIN